MKIGSLLLAASLLLTGCGLQKAVDSAGATAGKMDDTLQEMKNLNNKQCKAITFQDLLDPKFGQDLSPVPFDLMPFAKEFAECTSAQDIIEVMYLWMKKLNELTVDGGMPSTTPPTADQIAAFNKHLMQTFSALQAVAGFLPESTVDQIIHDQIDADGRFQDTALQMLMLRVRFMRDVMLEASLFSQPLNNVGKIQKAIEYANTIDKIERLPFARPVNDKGQPLPSPIAIKITGLQAPFPAIEESLDPKLALDTWTSIRTKVSRCYSDPQMPATCNPSGVHEKLSKAAQAQLSGAQKLIDQKILSWGGTL